MKKKNLLLLVCFIALNAGFVTGAEQKAVVGSTTLPIAEYGKKEMKIHACIFGMFSGTYMDSLKIANHLLCDSIRHELTQNKDSIAYLKNCLNNSLKDSMTLTMLNKLSSPEYQLAYNPSGAWIIHCKDATTSVGLDSVIMDVFSGSTLVASGISDKDGNIQQRNIPQGSHFVVFFRKGYIPFSLKNIEVPYGRQLYIEILLNKPTEYLFQVTPKNMWLFITGGAVILLLVLFIITYRLMKRKRRARNAIKK